MNQLPVSPRLVVIAPLVPVSGTLTGALPPIVYKEFNTVILGVRWYRSVSPVVFENSSTYIDIPVVVPPAEAPANGVTIVNYVDWLVEARPLANAGTSMADVDYITCRTFKHPFDNRKYRHPLLSRPTATVSGRMINMNDVKSHFMNESVLGSVCRYVVLSVTFQDGTPSRMYVWRKVRSSAPDSGNPTDVLIQQGA